VPPLSRMPFLDTIHHGCWFDVVVGRFFAVATIAATSAASFFAS
jgi:hypothetical protein